MNTMEHNILAGSNLQNIMPLIPVSVINQINFRPWHAKRTNFEAHETYDTEYD